VETVACILCGSYDAELLFVGRDRIHNIPGEFNVVRCRTCSLVYLNPRPSWDELQKFYPVDYVGYNLEEASALKKLIRRGGWLKKRRLVEKWKREGAILDIGCGTGEFLQIMMRTGKWQVFGLEPNVHAALYAAQTTGADIFCGRLEEAEYPNHFFDVITMWHVLEHMHDPINTLKKVHNILKHDGILIIAVPILDCLDARLFGPYWSGYDVPRHMFTFSKTTLFKVLMASGFTSIHFETYVGGHDAFCISLSFWANEQLAAFPWLLGIVKSLSQNLLFRLVMTPWYRVLNLLGLGSTVVVSARPGEHFS
jgi:2-polyprenyl-3-methyl-5-hydroxy-6-metoxy-1,4-benzoquinol methylase